MSGAHGARALALLVTLAWLTGGCVSAPWHHGPDADRELAETVGYSRSMAAQQHFREADSALAAFVTTHGAGAPQSREAAYWRAVWLLDPHNPAANRAAAGEQLSLYLGEGGAPPGHADEARAMRRLVTVADSVQTQLQLLLAAPDKGGNAPARPATPREDELQREIQRLKDQLDRTQQELDRIKRRMTTRPPD